MAVLTEGMHPGEFIGELAMGIGYHVDAITLKSGENLEAGAPIAALQTGSPTVTVATAVSGTGGTVGNGTVTITADDGATAGLWTVEITTSGATGKFKVIRPDGTVQGTGTVGTAYTAGELNVTLADGAADWTAGDIITVDVSYANNESDLEWVEYDPDGTDGSQVLAGILMKDTDASSAAVATTALVRGPAMVNKNDLQWISGIDADQTAGGIAALMALGIKAV